MMLSTIAAVLSVLLSLSVAQQDSGRQEAAMRLVRASLSAPNADVNMIIDDAKHLFGDVLPESLNEFLIETSETGNVPSCACIEEDKPTEEELLYADRHAKRIESVKDDFDCMEREFDASSPDFDSNEAALVLRKCRLLVIRNIFSPQVIQSYKTDVTKFLNDVHFGKVDRIAKTSLGENGYHMRRGNKRFDIVMPQYLLNKDIVADKKVMDVLSNPQVFRSTAYFKVQSTGTVIAESGADDSQDHADEPYLFGDYAVNGVGSGDLPPYAITMFIPLLNMTAAHGPTEFCMGTNHYHGLSDMSKYRDKNLVKEGTTFQQVQDFEYGGGQHECPKQLRRSPLGNVGDVIFFDYTITHRGTRNVSPDLRAMSYVVYSRHWYIDSINFADANFDHTGRDAGKFSQFEELTQGTRLALVEKSDEEYERVPLESIQNFLRPKN